MSLVEEPTQARFWAKVEKTEGCWLWRGAKAPAKALVYGAISWNGRLIKAHRLSYAIAHGTLPAEIDHLCRVPLCVNPAHLEAVDHRTNVLRGSSAAAIHARQTHCLRGHALVDGNLYVRRSRQRVCRTCKRATDRNSSRSRRADGRKP